jgi:YD repeat-containing protein
MWEKTTLDPAGRTILTEKPGTTGTMTTAYEYDGLGRLERTASTNMADTLYEYDVLGNQTKTGLDVDGNGSLDLSSTDRITESHTQFANLGGDIWQESVQSVYATDNSDPITDTAVVQTRLTGLGDGLVGETVSIDIHGNEIIFTETLDRSTHTRTQRIDYPDSDMDAISTSISGLLVSSRNKTGVTMTFGYDDLGRRTTVTDPRTGAVTTHYDTAGRVDYIEDPQGNILTDYTYDASTGRKTLETDAHGNETRFAYNNQGQVTHTWGAGAHPVKYVYDETEFRGQYIYFLT